MQHLLALAVVVPAVLAQTYYGCYTDVPTRALTDSVLVNYTTMTVGDCETHCTGVGAQLWGLEYGGEWYVPALSSRNTEASSNIPSST